MLFSPKVCQHHMNGSIFYYLNSNKSGTSLIGKMSHYFLIYKVKSEFPSSQQSRDQTSEIKSP